MKKEEEFQLPLRQAVGCLQALIWDFVFPWTALKELLFLAKETLSERFKLFTNEQKNVSREEHAFFLGLLAFAMDGSAILIIPGSSCSISDEGTCS